MTDLVYILAASHSGSTLLTMLLATHPSVCTIGEMKATHMGSPDRYRCSCGKWISECPFWHQVGAAMRRRGFHFSIGDGGGDYRYGVSAYVRRLLGPLQRGVLLESVRDAALFLSPSWRKRLPRMQHRDAALAEAVCELSGANVIVDSSKIGLRLKYLLRNHHLNVKVVRLIRDGRGVALAYMRPGEFADATSETLRDGGAGGTRQDERQTMAQAARQWRRSNEEAGNVLRRLKPVDWTEVRYENLCADPVGTVRRLWEFMGLDPAKAGAIRKFRSPGHHVIGNGMRLDSKSTIALDERWRDVLDTEQLKIFDTEAGETNRRYGYM